MMIALPSKHYSGHCKAVEEDTGTQGRLEENWRRKYGQDYEND